MNLKDAIELGTVADVVNAAITQVELQTRNETLEEVIERIVDWRTNNQGRIEGCRALGGFQDILEMMIQ